MSYSIPYRYTESVGKLAAEGCDKSVNLADDILQVVIGLGQGFRDLGKDCVEMLEVVGNGKAGNALQRFAQIGNIPTHLASFAVNHVAVFTDGTRCGQDLFAIDNDCHSGFLLTYTIGA